MKNTLVSSPVIILISSSTDTADNAMARSFTEVSDIYTKPLTNEILTSIVGSYFSPLA